MVSSLSRGQGTWNLPGILESWNLDWNLIEILKSRTEFWSVADPSIVPAYYASRRSRRRDTVKPVCVCLPAVTSAQRLQCDEN